jgi:hypothetical protein
MVRILGVARGTTSAQGYMIGAAQRLSSPDSHAIADAATETHATAFPCVVRKAAFLFPRLTSTCEIASIP